VRFRERQGWRAAEYEEIQGNREVVLARKDTPSAA
jgi:hypothetical protein